MGTSRDSTGPSVGPVQQSQYTPTKPEKPYCKLGGSCIPDFVRKAPLVRLLVLNTARPGKPTRGREIRLSGRK